MAPGDDVHEATFGSKHVEFRQLSTEEIRRAKEEDAYPIVLPDCACEIEGGVYGQLIVMVQ